jgi:hypothetical protein
MARRIQQCTSCQRRFISRSLENKRCTTCSKQQQAGSGAPGASSPSKTEVPPTKRAKFSSETVDVQEASRKSVEMVEIIDDSSSSSESGSEAGDDIQCTQLQVSEEETDEEDAAGVQSREKEDHELIRTWNDSDEVAISADTSSIGRPPPNSKNSDEICFI